MKNRFDFRTLCVVSLTSVVLISGAAVSKGQFTQNKRDTVTIDSKVLPKDAEKGYRLFKGKCSECHGLDIALKMRMVPAQWDPEVKRMQAMASSQFNDEQAAAILRFLSYDELHRKSELGPAAAIPSSDSVTAGREFYVAQNCETCHSLAGKGGSMGSLDGVGMKLSRQQIVSRLHTQPSGSAMPPLPAGTTDAQVDHLADYLLTLTAH